MVETKDFSEVQFILNDVCMISFLCIMFQKIFETIPTLKSRNQLRVAKRSSEIMDDKIFA